MRKVLVLGISGMLGSMLFDYFLKKNIVLFGSTRKQTNRFKKFQNVIQFDAGKNILYQIKRICKNIEPDYFINCIGVINRYCRDDDRFGVINAIEINSLFPHKLSNVLEKVSHRTKIIQIATDCVFNGNSGGYNENSKHDAYDVYGKSKSLGEVRAKNILNIRCSIIGPELENKSSLLEWFLSQKETDDIYGYAHHFWNGVTALQFAEYCYNIIKNNTFNKLRDINHTLHLIKNETVSKYELLNIFKRVFKKDVEIKKVSNIGSPIDRSLISVHITNNSLISMEKAIINLKHYLDTESVIFKQS